MFRIIAIISAALILIPRVLEAQSFEQGKMFIDAGIKISIYNITNENEVDDGKKDRAASYTIPIGFEYAVTDRIGAGIEIGICNYFTEEDSITRAIAKANSFDVLLKGNFHWVRNSRIDLSSGLGIGISSFRFNSNDHVDSEFTATGTYIRLNLVNFRVYVVKGVGLTAFLGIPYMNFNNGRISDNLGSDFEYPLSFAGFDIGTGLVVRF